MKKSSENNPHTGHRARVRRKIRNGALENMCDHEVLEYLLFHSVSYRDTNPLAHRLIDHFGSFHAVFDAPVEELLRVEGVTELTATFLSSLPCVFERYSEDINKVIRINSVEDVEMVMKMKFIGATLEKIYMICLDGEMKMSACVLLNEGNFREVYVDNREVVKLATKNRAKAVIIVHNHPNNTPQPSADDFVAAFSLKKTLGMVGIELVDSIIVAGDKYIPISNEKVYRKH